MIRVTREWLERVGARWQATKQVFFGARREELLHQLADRVFLLRGRLGRLRWRPRHSLRWVRLPHIDWRRLVMGVTLWHAFRRHHRALAALALVAIIASGGFRIINAVRANPPKIEMPKAVDVWYFDLGTGKLYVAPSNSPLPMKAPSGALGPDDTLGGVRAHVYACHSCSDPKDRFIGYIESANTPPDTGGKPVHLAPGMTASAHYVARPNDTDAWYLATSPDGLSVANEAQSQCGREQQPKYCTP